jgi:preprotein translocase subunit SecE
VSNTTIIILLTVFAVVFALLWWQGQIARLAAYTQETREELKKCSWPTWEELKGSTALIIISIALLGAFTVAINQLLYLVFNKL